MPRTCLHALKAVGQVAAAAAAQEQDAPILQKGRAVAERVDLTRQQRVLQGECMGR